MYTEDKLIDEIIKLKRIFLASFSVVSLPENSLDDTRSELSAWASELAISPNQKENHLAVKIKQFSDDLDRALKSLEKKKEKDQEKKEETTPKQSAIPRDLPENLSKAKRRVEELTRAVEEEKARRAQIAQKGQQGQKEPDILSQKIETKEKKDRQESIPIMKGFAAKFMQIIFGINKTQEKKDAKEIEENYVEIDNKIDNKDTAKEIPEAERESLEKENKILKELETAKKQVEQYSMLLANVQSSLVDEYQHSQNQNQQQNQLTPSTPEEVFKYLIKELFRRPDKQAYGGRLMLQEFLESYPTIREFLTQNIELLKEIQVKFNQKDNDALMIENLEGKLTALFNKLTQLFKRAEEHSESISEPESDTETESEPEFKLDLESETKAGSDSDTESDTESESIDEEIDETKAEFDRVTNQLASVQIRWMRKHGLWSEENENYIKQLQGKSLDEQLATDPDDRNEIRNKYAEEYARYIYSSYLSCLHVDKSDNVENVKQSKNAKYSHEQRSLMFQNTRTKTIKPKISIDLTESDDLAESDDFKQDQDTPRPSGKPPNPFQS